VEVHSVMCLPAGLRRLKQLEAQAAGAPQASLSLLELCDLSSWVLESSQSSDSASQGSGGMWHER
jgi:hypothetical protein